jgi:hypothetical protein
MSKVSRKPLNTRALDSRSPLLSLAKDKVEKKRRLNPVKILRLPETLFKAKPL